MNKTCRTCEYRDLNGADEQCKLCLPEYLNWILSTKCAMCKNKNNSCNACFRYDKFQTKTLLTKFQLFNKL